MMKYYFGCLLAIMFLLQMKYRVIWAIQYTVNWSPWLGYFFHLATCVVLWLSCLAAVPRLWVVETGPFQEETGRFQVETGQFQGLWITKSPHPPFYLFLSVDNFTVSYVQLIMWFWLWLCCSFIGRWKEVWQKKIRDKDLKTVPAAVPHEAALCHDTLVLAADTKQTYCYFIFTLSMHSEHRTLIRWLCKRGSIVWCVCTSLESWVFWWCCARLHRLWISLESTVVFHFLVCRARMAVCQVLNVLLHIQCITF